MTPTEALQAWLALEHEAVWLYPVVGARLDALRDRATTSFEAHRDVRDDLVVRLRTRGVEPVSASLGLSLIHISAPTRLSLASRLPPLP
ncbi:ferritin-like domain-containing protein [Aeromicrobium fastidiosum]|uniref:DUF4439 domain-containing protein n=1 Tax=Aeromicrobium fastidiosum TaxID=52699 RepID=UPI002023593E|nr:DUF4439 domain-containing protein [Aeromicrobium fastidiosum]MCL8253410.1 ferritin-like domain-containing protein [Aeromicrobium fastidiosum]